MKILKQMYLMYLLVKHQHHNYLLVNHQHHNKERQGNCRARGGFRINPACCAALLHKNPHHEEGRGTAKQAEIERKAPISTVGGCVNPPSGPPFGASGGGIPSLEMAH